MELGEKNNIGEGRCIHYYACRKIIAPVNGVRFFGGRGEAQMWG